MKRLITTREAAEKLKITAPRLQAIIEEHRLPVHKIGRDFMVAEEDLDVVADRQSGRTPSQIQRDFWDSFRLFLEERGSSLKPGKQDSPRYLVFKSWKSGAIRLASSVHIKDRQVWVDLTIGGPRAKDYFRQLIAERESIEGEIESATRTDLEWVERSTGKESWILARKRANTTDREDWPNQHNFLIEALEAFFKSFDRRIRRLK